MIKPTVSIIIPCYNASRYIVETFASILGQEFNDFEVIVIDDGSTDKSKELIEEVNDKRVLYHYQTNKGVSAARNEGLKMAKGDFIIFFDADDQMADEFLSARLNALKKDDNLNFVSLEVIKFNETSKMDNVYRGATSLEDILFYNQEIVTCPSNYMFKKKFLQVNDLKFSEDLSSTADRFFLIQCAMIGKGEVLNGNGKLLYRVSENSMSAKLTSSHVRDNEMFYEKLKKEQIIPTHLRNKSLFLGNYILFASNWKLNLKVRSIQFAIKAFMINPLAFIKKTILKA